MRIICSRKGCENEIYFSKTEAGKVVKLYCSPLCRYLGRGSKRAKRKARGMK